MSLVVRVIAPTGRDAELIIGALQQNSLAAEICVTPELLFADDAAGPLGPLLIAEEALSPKLVAVLGDMLKRQPAWSDLPILILTSNGREKSVSDRGEYDRLPLGAPILLERPIRTGTLASSVRAALRARARQYEIRDAFHDRDQALAELKEQRETLEVMLDNLPVGVVLARASGEIVLGNRSIERIFRHPVLLATDIEAHGEYVAFHPDGRRVAGPEYPLPRAMATGRAIPPEDFLYRRGDGTDAWISVTAAPILNDQGIVTGGVVAVSDVDQQRRAAEDLHRSNERFRRLIETASIGILIGDVHGAITYANPVILKLLGYTEEEVRSGVMRWDQITPAAYNDLDQRAVEQLETAGTAETYEKAYIARDGRVIPLLVGATVIPSQKEAGSPSEVAVFLTDLTTQKQAEAALIQSEKLAIVGRLAASISHEINNPLEAVTNLIYLARHQDGIDESIEGFLKTADEELRRVSQIVAQTLRFHRQSTRPRAITPDELLEPTLGLYRGRLTNSDIELDLQHRGAQAVTCSEGDVRQVLNNLVGNALDSMRTGGRLTIRTRNARRWQTGRDAIRITIADTGQGMTPEVMQRIFEPFYTTKGIQGTGLGLWISAEIVQKHHGCLQVYSRTTEGRSGTVFSLLLPVVA